MGAMAREAKLGVDFGEHDRLDRPDQAKHLMLNGKDDVADPSDCDVIIGYDLVVNDSAGALPHCPILILYGNRVFAQCRQLVRMRARVCKLSVSNVIINYI